MEFTDENVHDVFQLLAAILHLGNVRFITAGGAQVENMNSEEYTQTPRHTPQGGHSHTSWLPTRVHQPLK